MKIIKRNKTKKERIFKILKEQGWISDKQSAEILGENCYNVYEYKRMWVKLNSDREFFEGKKIIEKKKGYRCHMVRIAGMEEGEYYKVGKEFFNELSVY